MCGGTDRAGPRLPDRRLRRRLGSPRRASSARGMGPGSRRATAGAVIGASVLWLARRERVPHRRDGPSHRVDGRRERRAVRAVHLRAAVHQRRHPSPGHAPHERRRHEAARAPAVQLVRDAAAASTPTAPRGSSRRGWRRSPTRSPCTWTGAARWQSGRPDRTARRPRAPCRAGLPRLALVDVSGRDFE